MPHSRVVTLALLTCAAFAASIHPAHAESSRPEVYDAQRQILFWGEPETGAVHVVGLRQTLSEFGVLRLPDRSEVRALHLADGGRALLVDDAATRYRYDSRSLRLLGREALMP